MKKLLAILTIAACALSVQARQPERGYRGFIEWSNSVTSYKFDDRLSLSGFYTGGATSHGYQFNPNFYLGAGLAVEHCSRFIDTLVPLFIDVRTDQKFGRFTPYGDLRLGYNATDSGGIYFSPTLGYRFNWGRKVGINLGVGLSVIGYKVYTYDISIDPEGYFVMTGTGSRHKAKAYFSFRLGIDF